MHIKIKTGGNSSQAHLLVALVTTLWPWWQPAWPCVLVCSLGCQGCQTMSIAHVNAPINTGGTSRQAHLLAAPSTTLRLG